MVQPKAKYTAGAISAVIYENEIQASNGVTAAILKATVQRVYRDKNGTWESSGSFSRNEIPLAIYSLQKCFEYMIEGQKDKEDNNSSVEGETVV